MSAARHIDPQFGPAELESVTAEERERLLTHLALCDTCAAAFAQQAEAWSALALAVPPVAPPPQLWERISSAVAGQSRFEHLVERSAQLLDLSLAKVRELFAAIDLASSWGASPSEGVSLFHIDPGPRLANAMAGFVRITPGASFPHHRHLGPEHMLVMQGSYATDAGERYEAGADHLSPAGAAHTFTALPGLDLIYIGVVESGLDVGGLVLRPGDPRI